MCKGTELTDYECGKICAYKEEGYSMRQNNDKLGMLQRLSTHFLKLLKKKNYGRRTSAIREGGLWRQSNLIVACPASD